LTARLFDIEWRVIVPEECHKAGKYPVFYEAGFLLNCFVAQENNMPEDKSNHFQEAVVNNSNWVNKVLIAGEVLAGTIILLKLTGKTTFKWGDVEINTDKAWIIFLLFSLAHVYTAWLFIKSIHELWKTHNQEECQTTFNKVISSGGLFVRGLIPRTKKIRGIYQMTWSDPSTMISHLAALLLIPAIIPFDVSNRLRFILYIVTALIVMVFNWIVGSNWAIALSQLTVDRSQALYHLKLLNRRA
jgi:hypothetical protein